MSYDETIKDIEKTFGTVPGFMKETPEDISHICGHCLQTYNKMEELFAKSL
jgi:hypothetical protein